MKFWDLWCRSYSIASILKWSRFSNFITCCKVRAVQDFLQEKSYSKSSDVVKRLEVTVTLSLAQPKDFPPPYPALSISSIASSVVKVGKSGLDEHKLSRRQTWLQCIESGHFPPRQTVWHHPMNEEAHILHQDLNCHHQNCYPNLQETRGLNH